MSTSSTSDRDLETVDHPLAILKSEFLSYDDKLHLPRHDTCPIVLFEDEVYVRDSPSPSSGNNEKGRMLRYSLDTTGSWNTNTPLPSDVVRDYFITVVSSKLVLVGGISAKYKQLTKVWVRERALWREDIIPSVPIDETSRIQSATGYNDLLFVAYSASMSFAAFNKEYNMNIVCYDATTSQWKKSFKIPVEILNSYGAINLDLIVHNSDLYAKVYCRSVKASFFKIHYSSTAGPGEWVNVDSSRFILGESSRMTVSRNKLIVADVDSSVLKLYTPCSNADNLLTMQEIDRAEDCEIHSLNGITSLSDGSLLVMGEAVKPALSNKSARPSVIKFTSKVMPYDCDGYFTLKAIKRLERVAGIPVLSDPLLTEKLDRIKEHAVFNIQYCGDDESSVPVIEYMSSWLTEFKNKQCRLEPTWRIFLRILKVFDLTDLAKRIKECLETAQVVKQAEPKQDTGIEELHTLKAKLMNLRDQLKQKKEIDATWLNKIVAECYQSISTITIKIEKEQTTYKVELECLKENNRCLIADLEEKSREAEEDQQPPAKRPRSEQFTESEQPRFSVEDFKETCRNKDPKPTVQDQAKNIERFMLEVVILLHTVKVEEMVAVYDRLKPPMDLDNTILYRTNNGIEVTLGVFGDHKAALICTSKGADCRHEIERALKSLPGLQLIIAVGFAYGRRDKCKLGDVLVSTTVDGVSNFRIDTSGEIKIDEGDVRHTAMSMNTRSTFTKRIWSFFVCSKDEKRESKIHCGVIISSPMLLNNRDVLQKIIAREERFIGGEMEGQELAQLISPKDGEHHKVDFIVIKGVGDYGDGTKEKDWQYTASLAAADYAEMRLRDTQNKVYKLS